MTIVIANTSVKVPATGARSETSGGTVVIANQPRTSHTTIARAAMPSVINTAR